MTQGRGRRDGARAWPDPFPSPSPFPSPDAYDDRGFANGNGDGDGNENRGPCTKPFRTKKTLKTA